MEYTYEIEQDEDPLNPRNEFDNVSTFYSVHDSHYMTGGKHDVEYAYREDLEDTIKDLRKAGAVIVEFSRHSGNQYAVVDTDALNREYIKAGYSMRKAKYWARRCAQGEINTWIAWCEGEVYGYVVKSEEDDHVDSCWGFYGQDGRKQAIEEAESFIVWKVEDDAKQEKLFNVSMAI